MDTMSMVTSVAVEPWWAKYLFEIFVAFMSIVVLPPFIAWRNKQNRATQAIIDSAVSGFNYAEKLQTIAPEKAAIITKLDAAMERAVSEYHSMLGKTPSESDTTKIRSQIEALVYEQNLAKLAGDKLGKLIKDL